VRTQGALSAHSSEPCLWLEALLEDERLDPSARARLLRERLPVRTPLSVATATATAHGCSVPQGAPTEHGALPPASSIPPASSHPPATPDHTAAEACAPLGLGRGLAARGKWDWAAAGLPTGPQCSRRRAVVSDAWRAEWDGDDSDTRTHARMHARTHTRTHARTGRGSWNAAARAGGAFAKGQRTGTHRVLGYGTGTHRVLAYGTGTPGAVRPGTLGLRAEG
jgi:hypothetical protein